MSERKKYPSLEGVNFRLPHELVAELRVVLSHTHGATVWTWPAAMVVREAMARYVADAERHMRPVPVRD